MGRERAAPVDSSAAFPLPFSVPALAPVPGGGESQYFENGGGTKILQASVQLMLYEIKLNISTQINIKY